MKKREPLQRPESEQLKKELDRLKYKRRYRNVFISTIYMLLAVAAAAILVATLLMPVLRIYGTSMTPLLTEKDIVISIKSNSFQRGDIVSFYYNNKILVKRVIAFPGEWVDMDEGGHVFINSEPLDEPYLVEHAIGECDIELPYQVPEDRIFVMGDHRSTSVDSRSSSVGCVFEEQIVGKIIFRVWPFNIIGPI